jgi:glycylpeptide N-tetradecanoyltransferase
MSGSLPSGDQSKPRTTGLRIEDLFKLLAASSPGERKPMDEYRFWKTQPVAAFDEKIEHEGPIDNTKTPEDVPQKPQELPPDFEWSTIDITNGDQVEEVYDLLYHNYIEDNDNTFRFKYSAEFLSWALQPPEWKKEWNVGVRVKESGRLVGFISGVPAKIRVRDSKPIDIAEINFLCVHKKLRSKRLAPVLIREVTRRVNLCGVWQALYTAGVVLPSPVSTCRYYHRSINWPKLHDVGFADLPQGSTPAGQVAKYALPAAKTIKNFRKMEERDLSQVFKLLDSYLKKFDIAPIFTEEELGHWLLSAQDKVTFTYVITDESDDSIVTDFISFYCVESTVLGNSKHNEIKTAYGFYMAPAPTDSEEQLTDRLTLLYQNALIMAKSLDLDVFNALTLQDNVLVLDKLKFGAGDGFLNYYLFNYRAFPIHGGIDEDKQMERKVNGGVGVIML